MNHFIRRFRYIKLLDAFGASVSLPCWTSILDIFSNLYFPLCFKRPSCCWLTKSSRSGAKFHFLFRPKIIPKVTALPPEPLQFPMTKNQSMRCQVLDWISHHQLLAQLQLHRFRLGMEGLAKLACRWEQAPILLQIRLITVPWREEYIILCSNLLAPKPMTALILFLLRPYRQTVKMSFDLSRLAILPNVASIYLQQDYERWA